VQACRLGLLPRLSVGTSALLLSARVARTVSQLLLEPLSYRADLERLSQRADPAAWDTTPFAAWAQDTSVAVASGDDGKGTGRTAAAGETGGAAGLGPPAKAGGLSRAAGQTAARTPVPPRGAPAGRAAANPRAATGARRGTGASPARQRAQPAASLAKAGGPGTAAPSVSYRFQAGRVLCISAAAGQGKSTLSALLCRDGTAGATAPPGGGIVAYHFAKFSDARRLDAIRIIKSLAFQLALRYGPRRQERYC
jgi:hypothetical protein